MNINKVIRRCVTLFEIMSAIMFAGCSTFPSSINGVVYPAPKSTLESEFIESMFVSSNGTKMATRMYMPYPTSPKGLPLVVYLHGAGQNGCDNTSQLDDSVGCLYSFSYARDDYKAAILVPQCPAGVYWRDERILESLVEMIRSVAASPFVDSNRVYITGFSMGGDASWKIALSEPSLPTTIIPVCGGPMNSMEPDIPFIPDAMTNINIWAFNNFDDTVVRPNYSKRIFSRLWTLSPTKETLNFTEGVSGGHSPKQVYSNRDVLIWMMNTHR